MLRMKGWRQPIQTWRANATSGRFCSSARRSFFGCQFEAVQAAPDQDAVDLDPEPVAQLDHQFIKGQVALLPDPPRDPVHHARQLAVPTAVAPGLGLQRAGSEFQQHHVVHELDRNPELRRRSPKGMTFLNKIKDALTKLQRKWLADY